LQADLPKLSILALRISEFVTQNVEKEVTIEGEPSSQHRQVRRIHSTEPVPAHGLHRTGETHLLQEK
jgi:hypothetical protein